MCGGGGFQAEGAASEKAPGHNVLKEQPEAGELEQPMRSER